MEAPYHAARHVVSLRHEVYATTKMHQVRAVRRTMKPRGSSCCTVAPYTALLLVLMAKGFMPPTAPHPLCTYQPAAAEFGCNAGGAVGSGRHTACFTPTLAACASRKWGSRRCQNDLLYTSHMLQNTLTSICRDPHAQASCRSCTTWERPRAGEESHAAARARWGTIPTVAAVTLTTCPADYAA